MWAGMGYSEREIIERVFNMFRWHPKELMGRGDDVAVLEARGLYYVYHIDSFVWSTDFLPGMSFRDAGWKAVVSSLSDLAAKGAKPLGVLVSGGFQPEWTRNNVTEVLLGIDEAVRVYDTYVLGGDTNESSDGFLSVFTLGISKHKPPSRRGAKPGDYIVITGLLGVTSTAYKILLEGFKAPDYIKKSVLEAVYRPKARFDAGYSIAPMASASMDISDGLALSLHQMCELSGVGAYIEEIPIHPLALEFSRIHDLRVDRLILYEGGEEYELLFAIPPEKLRDAFKAAKNANIDLHVIGKFTEEKRLVYKFGDDIYPLDKAGWEHLRG